MSEDKDPMATRIDALEEHAAHQARTIEDLSDQLAEQWSKVDQLTKKQKKLIERLVELEEQVREAPPVTKPPHY